MQKFIIGSALAAILSVGAGNAAVAQENPATPTVPLAADCTAEPIPFARLSSLSATPVAATEVASAEASPGAGALPDGEPADEATVAELQASISQLISCLNAGDSLRTLSLYSDSFINSAFGGLNITQEMYDAEAGDLMPRPEGMEVALVSFGDAVILPDGRAAIIVVGDDRSSPAASSGTLFYLENVDGQWLVDETLELGS